MLEAFGEAVREAYLDPVMHICTTGKQTPSTSWHEHCLYSGRFRPRWLYAVAGSLSAAMHRRSYQRLIVQGLHRRNTVASARHWYEVRRRKASRRVHPRVPLPGSESLPS